MTCFVDVLPHILSGVALIGVDSVMAPLSKRQSAWARSARDLGPGLLAEMTRVERTSKMTGLANAPSSTGRRIESGRRIAAAASSRLAEISTRATVLLPVPQPIPTIPPGET
jgi:hypothetical protein